MSMGCSRSVHDSGFCLHPWSDQSAAHGTGGNADAGMTAYPFDLPSIREGVDIQDAGLFRKPDRGLDRRSIPSETLQVEISLPHKGGQVWALHGNAFMLDAMRMCACTIVSGMQILSVQRKAVGER